MCIHFNDWAFKIQDSRIILMLFAFVDKWDGMLVILHLEVSHIAPSQETLCACFNYFNIY